ncbi:unnamed protein product [Coffea canephora]|uniref:Protein kinase domain-containing protein n=1 Tax=Coffea canephora TaxID=49390 RepID=A0A068UDJ4_COFCA|nr:unnamed protein product [Coffea canephora]
MIYPKRNLEFDSASAALSWAQQLNRFSQSSIFYCYKGIITQRLGGILKLMLFSLENNQIEGSIPIRAIGKLISLKELYLGVNNLTGVITYEVGNLQTLEALNLRFNSLKGSIPTRIFNISTLRVLSLVANSLSVNLPSNMGLGLPNLEELFLSSNNLGGLFFTTLTECRYLRKISVANNPLTGILPVSIGNLSSSIEDIYAGGYKMKGRIPKTVGNLSNLRVLGLQENPLPDSLCSLQYLNLLRLIGNQFLHNSKAREVNEIFKPGGVSVQVSETSGEVSEIIPLGNLTSLRYLYLASSRITSHVPDSFWSLKDLLGFILSSNFLTGSLPSEIGLLKVATWIDFLMNQFANNIPSRIGDSENLNPLSLAYNNFEGTIPESISNMLTTSMSLSIIYRGKFHLTALSRISLPNTSIHISRTKKVLQTKLIVFGASAIIAGIALAFLFVRYIKKEKVPNGTNLFSLTAKGRISYYELLQATNGYDESNLLGSFGSVYKGILANGMYVAIKAFNLQLEYSFKSCTRESESLIIIQRMNVMIDVASALEYLHHCYSIPVVHCDLKPSNVLLNRLYVHS